MKEQRTAEPIAEEESREPAPQRNAHEAIAPGGGREPVAPKEDRAASEEEQAEQQFRMDVLVGYVLLGGVVSAMVLIAIGLIWHWAATGTLGLDYSMGGMNFFQFVVSDVETIIRTGFGPRRMINLGVAVLMLTPFVRVASSMLYFGVVEHNWKYTVFTGFVLAVLTYSLFLR